MSILSFMKTNLNMIFESRVPHSVVLNYRTIEILMFKSCQTPSSQPIQSIICGKTRIHSISKWAALMYAVNGDFRPAFGSVHMSLSLFFHATSYCLLTCSGLSVCTTHTITTWANGLRWSFLLGDFCFSHSLSESLPKTHHCLSPASIWPLSAIDLLENQSLVEYRH